MVDHETALHCMSTTIIPRLTPCPPYARLLRPWSFRSLSAPSPLDPSTLRYALVVSWFFFYLVLFSRPSSASLVSILCLYSFSVLYTLDPSSFFSFPLFFSHAPFPLLHDITSFCERSHDVFVIVVQLEDFLVQESGVGRPHTFFFNSRFTPKFVSLQKFYIQQGARLGVIRDNWEVLQFLRIDQTQ
jgi:hypothetical protein